ncbi:hypothetical protein EF847_06840 [Actinobacteria bacterium YIM 96077]|uniref:Uncharacterized protein n=1 Tax=Phytoactinopolyspora halophila TaxID=1981511 RepID=A0A329QC68_9ACTN|nr:hypothetical protein [Phytoactinopolyspora halophila]AYY12464.1 hypothetical protein EF847_06840 [Actinobacteria bacterium YIM 96077]RAW09339.1 hypothetical protein DPM12_21750 [Phytoactinopolyspora halophila]
MCDDDMRPNPAHGAIEEILQDAEAVQADIAEALDEAHRIMNDGEAWTGPTTAQAFLDELEERKGNMPRLAERLVEDIRDALNNTPEEVPSTTSGGSIPV